MASEPTPEDAGLNGTKAQYVRITAHYANYKPPFEIEPIIRRMLDTIPDEYLSGLSEVVLTNTSGLNRARRRSVTRSRKRKVRQAEARGLYHPAWRDKAARIEIFVDNTLRGWVSGLWLRIPLIRENPVGDVLFHEVGHHIHFTTRPEHREREDVADQWKVRLERQYYKKRFPLMRIIVRALKVPFGGVIDSMTNKSLRDQLRKKRISRAEFDERMKD